MHKNALVSVLDAMSGLQATISYRDSLSVLHFDMSGTDILLSMLLLQYL